MAEITDTSSEMGRSCESWLPSGPSHHCRWGCIAWGWKKILRLRKEGICLTPDAETSDQNPILQSTSWVGSWIGRQWVMAVNTWSSKVPCCFQNRGRMGLSKPCQTNPSFGYLTVPSLGASMSTNNLQTAGNYQTEFDKLGKLVISGDACPKVCDSRRVPNLCHVTGWRPNWQRLHRPGRWQKP